MKASPVETLARLRAGLADFNRALRPDGALSVSLGAITVEPGEDRHLEALLAAADGAMYEDKASRRGGFSLAG